MRKIISVDAEGNTIELFVVSPSILVWGENYQLNDFGKEYTRGLVHMIATPDMFSDIFEQIGIDYKAISEFELFSLLAYEFPEEMKRIFELTVRINGKIMSNFELCKRTTDNKLVVRDEENDITITEETYKLLSSSLKSIIEPNFE